MDPSGNGNPDCRRVKDNPLGLLLEANRIPLL